MHRGHPVTSCFAKCDRLTRPLCSSPITGPSSLIRVVPPQCSASVLSPRGFGRLGFSLNIGARVPAVPCNRLHPLHPLSTPVATRPVIRHLADLSQMIMTHLVSTSLEILTTRPRQVYFRPSLGSPPPQVFPALFLHRSPPT